MKTESEIKYADIINLEHHVSDKHPHMSMIDRAAQFSPFAALTGYDAAVRETARLTDARVELDDAVKEILNDKLRFAQEHPDQQVQITYFQPDLKKDGGSYDVTLGHMKKLDEYARVVVLQGGVSVPIDEIVDVELITE